MSDLAGGAGTNAGAIVIAEVPGLSADHDRITADLAAHWGDGSDHPAVSHSAGVDGAGLFVVDVWGSGEEFGADAQAELAPNAGDRFADMKTRLAKVRTHVQAKS